MVYHNKQKPEFASFTYRVKPEEPKKKWRRFLDTAEVFAHNNGSDVLWVKNKESGRCRMVTSYDDCKFSFDTGYELTMEELFDEYTFKDGTPCGVEEL